MRLGGSVNMPYSSPKEWLKWVKELNYSAVIFPVDSSAEKQVIRDYQKCIADEGLVIGEVGVWRNLLARDANEREKHMQYSIRQLELAEEVGANCCVNISGSTGTYWDGYDPDNYSRATYDTVVEQSRRIMDAVKPVKTKYSLEPMPWMIPDSAEGYLQLLKDIDREAFGVHLDFTNMINGIERFHNRDRFIEECFEKLGPWIRSIHIKDVALGEGELPCVIREVPVGEGAVDLGRVLQLSEALGEDTTVFTEHMDKHEDYLKATRYLRALSEKVGVKIK